MEEEKEELKEGVLYEYHRLEQRDNVKMSSIWIVLQIVCLALCAFFSFIALVFISGVVLYFEDGCIFHPKVIVFKDNTTEVPPTTETPQTNETMAILRELLTTTDDTTVLDQIKTSLSDSSACFLPYFFPVLSIIASIIWLVFFVMFKGLKHPWRIVTPALVFISVFALFSYIVQVSYMGEVSYFKDMFVNASIVANQQDHYQVKEILINMDIYTVSTWLNTVFWILSAVVLILRLITGADFNYILVKVELVKIRPEDVPLLPKCEKGFDASIQSIVCPPAPEAIRKKNVVSIIKPSKNKNIAQRVHSMIDDESSDVTSQESLTLSPLSPRVIINPMTVTVDIETGMKKIERIQSSDPTTPSSLDTVIPTLKNTDSSSSGTTSKDRVSSADNVETSSQIDESIDEQIESLGENLTIVDENKKKV